MTEGANDVGAASPPVHPEGATRSPNPGPVTADATDPDTGTRRASVYSQLHRMVAAIRNGDDALVESVILSLSQRSRFLAPLTLVVGAFAMLFQGVKLLFTNWRLTLIQVLPAMLIWLAMLDLKLHLLRGKSLRVIEGPILIPIVLAIAAVTAAAYFLNAVFAFSVADPLHPDIRPAFARARKHRKTVLGWGFVIGLGLGFATMVMARWGRIWFALVLSVVVAIMMITYVAVPARIIGVKSDRSRRDKLTATAIGGAVGAVVCSPPYLLGRVGIILLGIRPFFVVGIILLVIAVPLQTGAVTATKAVKFSAKLVTGQAVEVEGASELDSPASTEPASAPSTASSLPAASAPTPATQPAPTQPAPTQPAPTQPAPTQPAPTGSTPSGPPVGSVTLDEA